MGSGAALIGRAAPLSSESLARENPKKLGQVGEFMRNKFTLLF